MQAQFPNAYYEELYKLIIDRPALALMQGEVCFYQKKAKSYQNVTQLKATPKKKTSLFWTPWVAGIKQKKTVEVREETKTEYYGGIFYITNMRLVFECAVDNFNLMIPQITSVNQHKDGIRVVSGRNTYDIMTSDVKGILHILDLMNKAQSGSKAASTPATENAAASRSYTKSRNDDHAMAAFVHYCSFGGKPISKDNNSYPRWFGYDFNINNPAKYHQKVVDAGYLEVAPLAISLKGLKVDQLKRILASNGLSDKGKKEQLIQRIVDEADTSAVDLEKIYVPSQKGMELLSRYDYLFVVKKYGISVDEFEAQKKRNPSGRTNDIIWMILGKKYNEYNVARDFGLARNELLNKASFLSAENKQIDSLMHYILVLHYDMSGCCNGGRVEKKEDLCLAPGITKEIYSRKEHYSPEMLDRCFDRYKLPHHYLNKKSFEKLLQMIFDDETIDILKL